AWKHVAQREKEEELVFRGRQYVHAIALFQRKFANATPPSVDMLVEQRFLRKKFKDPITGDDFVPLAVGQMGGTGLLQPGPAGQRGQPAPGPGPSSTSASTTAPQPGGVGRSSTMSARGGIGAAPGGSGGAAGVSGGATGG